MIYFTKLKFIDKNIELFLANDCLLGCFYYATKQMAPRFTILLACIFYKEENNGWYFRTDCYWFL